MRVAVVGAGPSGLVTLKYLTTAHLFFDIPPIEVKLFEKEKQIGGTFFARTYEDAELVSSKQLTSFSDFRPRDEDSDFLSARRYLEYLHDYCSHFKLWEHIQLSTSVQRIRRNPAGTHTVMYASHSFGKVLEWECDAIAVCSGLHVLPNMPHIPGVENVPLTMHASEFKTRSQFGQDKTVLVLGSGETGADISYLAVTSPTKRVVLSHRDGFHFAPKRNVGQIFSPILGQKPREQALTVPLDNARASLFDTACVHPYLRDSMALWHFYDAYVRSILWVTSGTTMGLHQHVGGPSPERDHVSKIFFNKSNKAAPYISEPYRELANRSWLNRIRSVVIQTPFGDTHGRQIDLAPWPECFDEDGTVIFRNNGRIEYDRMKGEKIKPDIVVFCTGYRQECPFFERECRYPDPEAADVRSIWKRDDPTVGFIGFVRPSLGAIPPIAEMQAQLWILNLVAPQRIPQRLEPGDEPHYRLHHPKASRIHYGVDHESYVHQLATDMGSVPPFREVLRMGWERRLDGGWRLPLVWALGANYNTKFRLRGPWTWDGASRVLTTDLWEPIRRRRWFWDHFLLSFLPILVFGPLSMSLYVCTMLMRNILWPLPGGIAKIGKGGKRQE